MNRAQSLKSLDFVAPCDKSRVRVRVGRCAVAGCVGRVVSRGCRCAMGIAGGRVEWMPLCHGDCWAARPLGGAVSCGLLSRMWSGWHRVIRIGEQGVVWVAPIADQGRRIADQGLVWVAPCHWYG